MKTGFLLVGLAACLYVLILFPALFVVGEISLWKSIFGFVGTIFISCELMGRLPWGAEAEIAISLSDVAEAIKEARETASNSEDEKDGE